MYQSPPEELTIDVVKYPIDTDFRTWIKFQNIIIKKNTDEQKTADLLQFIADLGLPFSENTLKALLDFFTGGDTKPKKQEQTPPAYDFETDSNFIYTAYLTQYRIDLSQEKMHWWKFKAMFSSLSQEHTISKIMWARSADTKDMSDDMKEYISKIKNNYPLPSDNIVYKKITAEEHHKEMIENVKRRYIAYQTESNLS